MVIALEFVPTLQSVLCFFDRMEPVDCELSQSYIQYGDLIGPSGFV